MDITAQEIALTELHESPWNPRRHFPQKSLEELAESIRKVDVLSPLLVCPRDAGGYEMAAGHRRLRAAKLAKLAEVPCVVRPMPDQEFLEILTIENLQREDVHPLDEGEGYRTLMAQTGWLADEVAAKVGKSKSYVYQRLKLAELIEPAKTYPEPTCSTCKCTESNPCIDKGTGETCGWANLDRKTNAGLCTFCDEKTKGKPAGKAVHSSAQASA
jgi:ParB/RepB/Spo0J family partition protein